MPAHVTLHRHAIARRYPDRDVDVILRRAEEKLRQLGAEVIVDRETGAERLFVRGWIGEREGPGPSEAEVWKVLGDAAR